MAASTPTHDTVVVGIDIGGTFTDFVVVRDGRLTVYKEPSTPADPSLAFLRGLEALQIPFPARLVHGSTVATNAVLERRGARAALLATQGFRDVLQIGRQTRRELYSLTPTKPLPLIPRELSFEVPERVDKEGRVLAPLDESALDRVLAEIAASGAEALAIVFLFSFVNPDHERRAGERARALGLSVSLSSEILPEYREYERASTTAANAYVAPLMDRYLARLQQRLTERAVAQGAASFGRLQVMQSNGGVISVDTARREAVRTVLSGPAGGVVGAWKVAALAGFERLITFDMGGTSTDVALVEGAPVTSSEGSIADLPIRIPMLDIHTVGAGGGSIARREPGGSLRVGPESAGSDPGPAAYGRGDRPTVTDANVQSGRFHLPSFLGGRMALHPERSQAVLESLAEELGLPLERTAAGVLRVANVQMARALRRVSVERGHDPRRFCLVAFGGGGPLHACDLAVETGIPTVLIPRYPGALSALGMLLTEIRKEYSRTVMLPAAGSLAGLETVFSELEARAREELTQEGVRPEEILLERTVDARYQGQSYELPISAGDLDPASLAADFHRAHRERYGYASPEAAVEIVTARLRGLGAVPQPTLPHAPAGDAPAPQPLAHQPVYQDEGWVETPVYRREALLPGHRLTGPALIVQEDTTSWIPGGWEVSVDGWYNVIATLGVVSRH
jgi:N-methylhydantoinase A